MPNYPNAPAASVNSLSWEDLGFRESILAKNLAALERTRPDLVEMLRDSSVHELLTVRCDEDGAMRVFLSNRRTIQRIEERPAEIRRTSTLHTGQENATQILLVGAGTGERAAFLAGTLAPGEKLWLYERDPALLTLTLARRDWSSHFLAGRIHILFGADLYHTPWPTFRQAILHPMMAGRFAQEWAFVRENMDSGTEHVSSSEFPKQTLAVISGELLTTEVRRAVKDSDFQVVILDVDTLTRPQISAELERLRPAALLGINFLPEMAEICGALGVPYLAWEIDPTASAIDATDPLGGTSRNTWIFTWRRARVRELRNAGWCHVDHLPLAADPILRSPPARPDRSLGVPVFVGSCMRRQGQVLRTTLHKGLIALDWNVKQWSNLLQELRSLEDAVRRDPCRMDIPQRLRHLLSDFGIPNPLMIGDRAADPLMLAGEALAAEKRIALAKALIPEGLVVFGEKDWSEEIPLENYRGLLAHGEPLNQVYHQAAINIDMNRVYQPDIVTMRVFDALACGGFVLSEDNEEIRTLLLPGRDLEVFSSTSDLIEKTRYYRAHPRARAEMIVRGRDHVLREHTVIKRVQHMLLSSGITAPVLNS